MPQDQRKPALNWYESQREIREMTMPRSDLKPPVEQPTASAGRSAGNARGGVPPMSPAARKMTTDLEAKKRMKFRAKPVTPAPREAMTPKPERESETKSRMKFRAPKMTNQY